MSTEITKGMAQKFHVAYMVLKPALRPMDTLDVEMMLKSDRIPVSIKGYVTITGNGGFEPRVYISGSNVEQFSISRSARKKLRLNMNRLVAQIMGVID